MENLIDFEKACIELGVNKGSVLFQDFKNYCTDKNITTLTYNEWLSHYDNFSHSMVKVYGLNIVGSRSLLMGE